MLRIRTLGSAHRHSDSLSVGSCLESEVLQVLQKILIQMVKGPYSQMYCSNPLQGSPTSKPAMRRMHILQRQLVVQISMPCFRLSGHFKIRPVGFPEVSRLTNVGDLNCLCQQTITQSP